MLSRTPGDLAADVRRLRQDPALRQRLPQFDCAEIGEEIDGDGRAECDDVGGLGTAKQSIYLGPCTPPGRSWRTW